MNLVDYYAILELSPSASLKEVKAAYRRLAHQYHPDKTNNDKYAAAQFEIVKEAYEVLTDPSRKEQYLQQRWYAHSMGQRSQPLIVNPVDVLKRLIELDKYVTTLDVHRLDEEGLYSYIHYILSDEIVEKLNHFGDITVNKSIIEAALRAGQPLSFRYANELAALLGKIHSGEETTLHISGYLRHARSLSNWSTYRTWVVLLLVLALCLVIYFFSRS